MAECAQVRRFNGGLFADRTALKLEDSDIGLLIDAAAADWREVEPAIFGTLLERALDPRERHKLGAHFTPRAYVERLVLPAVVTAQYADEATMVALLAWCEADPEASMCGDGAGERRWWAGSDPCTEGWTGVFCDANGAVNRL